MKKQNMWSFSVKREVWKKFGGVISLKFDKNKNKAGNIKYLSFLFTMEQKVWIGRE